MSEAKRAGPPPGEPYDSEAATWTDWAPAGGWAGYADQAALWSALCEDLSEAGGQWHCMNFSQHLTVWECCADGSAILIGYCGDRLAELQTSGSGGALRHLLAIAASFGLTPRTPTADTG
ncbi:hypothetical protein SAMN04487939_101399 [Lysobacter sp. yr284]|uniref:hypothetical protein n=1 Tax=Lysobacter sp. yr284 TaxID=1761791 RepID=UPI00089862A2|nr:hypothetical protein [Lysobacter sp. yr284]SDY23698.1 hypothetical protein SAMN04487939_101399 [Lysobacter sp. yr284]